MSSSLRIAAIARFALCTMSQSTWSRFGARSVRQAAAASRCLRGTVKVDSAKPQNPPLRTLWIGPSLLCRRGRVCHDPLAAPSSDARSARRMALLQRPPSLTPLVAHTARRCSPVTGAGGKCTGT
eukprot:7384999-Prymnesium_polylepis.2